MATRTSGDPSRRTAKQSDALAERKVAAKRLLDEKAADLKRLQQEAEEDLQKRRQQLADRRAQAKKTLG